MALCGRFCQSILHLSLPHWDSLTACSLAASTFRLPFFISLCGTALYSRRNRYLVLKPHLNNRTLHSGTLWPFNPPIRGFSLCLMTSEVINIGLKLALSLDHLTGCFPAKPKPDEVQGNFDEHLTICWFRVCCGAYVHPHSQAMPLPIRKTPPQTDSSHSQYTNTDLCRSKLNKFRMKAHYKFILRLTKDELRRPSNILGHILFLQIQFSQELLYC